MLDQYQKINKIRRKVFEEVARLAYEGGDYKRIEELPYKICEKSVGRSSIFLERAIVAERPRILKITIINNAMRINPTSAAIKLDLMAFEQS